MAGWQPQTCTCGHTIAEHQSSGTRSLSAAALASRFGICLEPGCDCRRFADAASARSKKQASQEWRTAWPPIPPNSPATGPTGGCDSPTSRSDSPTSSRESSTDKDAA